MPRRREGEKVLDVRHKSGEGDGSRSLDIIAANIKDHQQPLSNERHARERGGSLEARDLIGVLVKQPLGV